MTRSEIISVLTSILMVIVGIISIPIMEMDCTLAIFVWFFAIISMVGTFWHIA